MSRVITGLLTAGLCCALFAACAHSDDGFSVTFFGRVELVEGDIITLQPGIWEDGEFIPNEDVAAITVPAQHGLAVLCNGENSVEVEDMQVGTVVQFTVTASMEDSERITSLEIVQQPQ